MSESEKKEETNTYPLKHRDISAVERYLAYSRSIQGGVVKFMIQNVGQLFPSLKDMAMESANTIIDKKSRHPHWTTTQRWIEQYSARNEEFELLEQPSGIVISRRRTDGK